MKFVESFAAVKIVDQDQLQLPSTKRLPDVTLMGLERTDYFTIEELQEGLCISRYQLGRLLKLIDARPLGEVRNLVEGRYTRGVGRLVYATSVRAQIEQLVAGQVDIARVKAEALQVLAG